MQVKLPAWRCANVKDFSKVLDCHASPAVIESYVMSSISPNYLIPPRSRIRATASFVAAIREMILSSGCITKVLQNCHRKRLNKERTVNTTFMRHFAKA